MYVSIGGREVAEKAELTKRERELSEAFELMMDIQFTKHKLRVMKMKIKETSLSRALKECALNRFNQAEKTFMEVFDRLMVLFGDDRRERRETD